MTRIFDALRKAEAARAHPPGPAPVTPLPTPHAATAHAAARAASPARPAPDALRVALPVVGAVDLGDDVLREMSSLRVSLEAALGERTCRVVMFTSPQGREGTTTVALQFAQALARDPSIRPLLVDTHVRRPAYRADGALRGAVLDPALMPRSGATGAVVTSNLFAVPAPDDIVRAGIFQPGALRTLLDATTAGFDWVVLDGPPVLESPDAAALAALADATVLVVQAGRTKRPVLVRAAEMLRKAGARLVGSVLNRRIHEIPEFIYRRI
jgi:Mrp family chromosome partitioning ATPase